tara:strand:+ start:356 stop:607 length:252 start_codon:yes stop_codon:yes gene_type:complete
MVDITRNTKVTVSISAFDMGQEFANMFDEEQAQFFNGIASVTKGWTIDACFQWHAMRCELDKLPAALAVFKSIAEYAPENYEE